MAPMVLTTECICVLTQINKYVSVAWDDSSHLRVLLGRRSDALDQRFDGLFCLCVYVVFVCVRVSVYVYVDVCDCVHMCVFVCVGVCMYVYKHACKCMCMSACVCMCVVCARECGHGHMRMHACVHKNMERDTDWCWELFSIILLSYPLRWCNSTKPVAHSWLVLLDSWP